MLRTTDGYSVSWDSHPSEDRSEPPPERDGSIIIPNFSIMASNRTTRLFSLSVDRSLPTGGHGGRRQVASRKEERSAALTIQFSRCNEGAIKNALLLYNGHFFAKLAGTLKNFFEFFSDGISNIFNGRKSKFVMRRYKEYNVELLGEEDGRSKISL